jgi:hypothetical protein
LSTNPVTNKNIKDDAVPPALIEVRQHMVECYLHTITPPAELSNSGFSYRASAFNI